MQARASTHLSAKEQRLLVQKYQEQGCQHSLDRLVRTNLKLACKVVSRYRHTRVDKDDLLSEAVQGIMRAAQKYDCNASASFATYAYYWIRAFCSRHLESYTKEPWQQSLDKPINTTGGTIATLIPDGAEMIDMTAERNELLARVRTAIKGFSEGLNEREETIFNLRTVAEEPLTLLELGDCFGITKERIRQIESSLFDKFKGYLLHAIG